MADLDSLKSLEGRRLRLTFTDGFVVDVRLLSVDPGEYEELTCDEERVVEWGSFDAATRKPGSGWTASVRDVLRWEVLE